MGFFDLLSKIGINDGYSDKDFEFVILEGEEKGKQYDLSPNIVSIGRMLPADNRRSFILIKDSSLSLSSNQADMKWDESSFSYVIVPKQTVNPTEVNGKEISGWINLSSGDIIRMGNIVLLYRKKDVKNNKPCDKNCMADNFYDNDVTVYHSIIKAEKTEEKLYEIEIIEGPFRGRSYTLNKSEFLIGRKDKEFKDLEFPGDDRSISRKHIRLINRGNSIFLINETKKSITSVNGEMVENTLLLKDGDEIRIGEKVLLLFREKKGLQEKNNGIFREDMKFIKGGLFYMGSDDEPSASPLHEVLVNSFYMDIYPVTNEKYFIFIEETGYKTEGDWKYFYSKDKLNHPVVNLSYNDANAYSYWAGKRLPTEAEWEYGARGSQRRIYPWGNHWDKCKLNSKESDLNSTSDVGKFPEGVSLFGIMDMMGNVWEWTSSLYLSYPYKEVCRKIGTGQVVRGGSWVNILQFSGCFLRFEVFPREFGPDIGFRCVKDVNGE